MQKRKCVQDIISHKQPAYLPYNVELSGELTNQVEKELDIEKGSFFSWAGNHIEKCGFEKGAFIKPGIYKDEYDVVWDRSGVDKDIGIILDYLFKNPDISEYEFKKVDSNLIKQISESFLENERDTYKYAKIGTTLFERAWSLRGFQNLFMDFLLEEKFVHELLTKITDFNLEVLDCALEYDFDGVYFGDDYGQQSGMMMSPDVWKKFLKPQLKRMFDKAKEKGKTICLHSCGDIDLVLPDLIDIGLDVYQTVQPEIYDLNNLKKEYGKDLTFYGGISTQRDLPFKTPRELKDIIRETMKVLGDGGGYIVAPTHRVTSDTPTPNIYAMIETFKEQS